MGDLVETDDLGAVFGLLDLVADLFDDGELLVFDDQAGRVAEKIEDGGVFDGPGHGHLCGFEKVIEFPEIAAKGTYIADGPHGDFD